MFNVITINKTKINAINLSINLLNTNFKNTFEKEYVSTSYEILIKISAWNSLHIKFHDINYWIT